MKGRSIMLKTRQDKMVFATFMVIAVAVLIYSTVIYPKYQEQKKEKAQQEAIELQKKAEKRAEEYVQEYASNLEDEMRRSAVDDITVTYRNWADETFAEYFGIKEDEGADCAFYYELTYSSELIDQIYADNTKDGNYESFIQIMEEEQQVKDTRYDPEYHRHEIKMDGHSIAVYIADETEEYETYRMVIQSTKGTTYRLDVDEGRQRLFVKNKEVYADPAEETSNGTESSSASGGRLGGSDSSGSSSSSGNSRSGWRTDPYDVYDYDDPDDFADEWAEEFGDGDFDDGYDDAYDYWEEEWD